MKRINQPKVFISYAWGTDDYQRKVLSFASSLISDGIDVLLDKWNVSAGNDLNSFMEKSVVDPTVTNVLILLDENYTNKANQKMGGVGTETQIISQQVYASVEQRKFIPIVFERNANGDVCKPAYLISRFHFDLSKEESYDKEYHNLVKTLYGVEVYKKPELGTKPEWVDAPIELVVKTITEYDALKENRPDAVKSELFISYLTEIKRDIESFAKDKTCNSNDEVLRAYDETRAIRSKYLMLLSKSVYYSDRRGAIGNFFEDTFNAIESNLSSGGALSKVFLHELFLYTIAYLYKTRSYQEVGYILGRTYFGVRLTNNNKPGCSFHLFYSGGYHDQLDKAVKARDGKNYLSGTAAYWISTLDADFCSKEDFVTADTLCFNYSYYGNGYLDNWEWFPVTYVYDDPYNGSIRRIAKYLISKEKLSQIMLLFNYDSENEFIMKFTKIEELIKERKLQNIRYSGAFESAPVLGFYIKAEEIGTVR